MSRCGSYIAFLSRVKILVELSKYDWYTDGGCTDRSFTPDPPPQSSDDDDDVPF